MTRSRLVLPLLLALLWVAVPAGARSQGGCPDGSACVWNRTGFTGARAEVPADGCIDSNIRSAVNRSDRVVHFFLSGGCAGAQAATLAPGQAAERMSAGSATGDCAHDVADPCGDEPPPAPVPSVS